MKIRTFKKCINRKKYYKYYPKYTRLIVGTGLGSYAVYWYGRMRWENGKFELKERKVLY